MHKKLDETQRPGVNVLEQTEIGFMHRKTY